MSKGYFLTDTFVSDYSNAHYEMWVHGNGKGIVAIYFYASSAAGNVCDMSDHSQSITADTWSELKRKLEKKHPTGWHWE